MCWLTRRNPLLTSPPAASPGGPGLPEDGPHTGFVCSTCGRSDLPEAGGWDPPICQECDAAINFDAEMESGAYNDL